MAGKNIREAELKQIELEILVAVDAFCREHNIPYYMPGRCWALSGIRASSPGTTTSTLPCCGKTMTGS